MSPVRMLSGRSGPAGLCALLLCLMATDPRVSAAENEIRPGTRPKVALVLSGGGARGGAHIGVLRALEEMRIPVDFVAGTSMGAVVGGLYASGLSAERINHIATGLDWPALFADRPPRAKRSFRRKADDIGFLVNFDVGIDRTGLVLPGSLVQGQNLEMALRRYTAPVAAIEDFDALPIPYRAVATDLATGETVVFDSGDLVTAMRASMAVPGLLRPEETGGRTLVDGGIANNLPIRIARDMGADLIIAVDVGFPLQPAAELRSGLAVTRQMLTILINKRAEDQLQHLDREDIHLEPDLDGIGSQQFHRLTEAIESGYREAEAHSAPLSSLSIPDGRYHAYRTRVEARLPPPATIDAVHIANDSALSTRVIDARLGDYAGRALDLGRLESDIADIYGLDTFESVEWDITPLQGQQILTVRTFEKSWGPNYLRFGINLEDDFDGGSNYNLASRLTMTEINPLGGEFRTELQIGESPRLFTEIYQPLDYASRWFLNPQLVVERSNAGLFNEGAQIAQFRATQVRASLDTGRQFGNWGEFRLGFTRTHSSRSLRIGNPEFDEDSGDFAAITSSFSFDTIDDVAIPRHGTSVSLGWNGSRESLGSDGDFDLASAFLLKPVSWGKNTLLHWWNIDSTLRDDTPGVLPFTLGGLFNLSGYQTAELAGSQRAMGRLLYYRRLGRQSLPGLNVPVYLGASLEGGNVWEDQSDIGFGDIRTAGSAFVVFDTLLGPLYLAYGVGEGGRRSAYLFLGQTF